VTNDDGALVAEIGIAPGVIAMKMRIYYKLHGFVVG
jgi:hypothetical protein